MKNIAKTLKDLRVEANLTQTELSRRLNIGQATIACYENGQREPQLSILSAYADYFECSIDYLVGRTDDVGNVIVASNADASKSMTSDERELLQKYKNLSANKKMKAQAFRSAISYKVKNNELIVVDGISLDEPKTKLMAQVLANLGCDKRTLVITAGDNAAIVRASNNIEKLTVTDAALANVYQLVANVAVIATKDAIKQIEEAYSL